MDEVQVEINEARVDSEDLVLLNDYLDLLLNTALPTEQFDINNYLPTSPKKTSYIQKISKITNKTKVLKKEQFDQNLPEISKKTEPFILKKDQLDQNCDFLSAAISESLKCNVTLKQKGTKPICTLCTKTFARKQVLKIHMESVHEGKKTFECDICGQKFAGKSSVKRHIEVVHEGKKRFQCSTCKVQFSKKENMERHVAAIHTNNRSSFFVLNFGSCPI